MVKSLASCFFLTHGLVLSRFESILFKRTRIVEAWFELIV